MAVDKKTPAKGVPYLLSDSDEMVHCYIATKHYCTQSTTLLSI